MARCGLRISEAIALRWDNVDLDKGRIELSQSMSRNEGLRPLKHREQGEARVILIPEDVKDGLRSYRDQQTDARVTGFVFTSSEGKPSRYSNWRRRVWSRIVEASGVDCVPHDLRRTATTRLFLEDGWSPPAVQAYMGHRDPRTTLKIYAKVNPADLPRPSSLRE